MAQRSKPAAATAAPAGFGYRKRCRRGKAPFGNPLGPICFFGKAGPYLCPATSYGRSGGRLFPSPVQSVPPRSAPTCPPLVSENIIGSLKNPTTGDDECGKVSKGALFPLAVPGSRWCADAHCGSPTAAPTIFTSCGAQNRRARLLPLPVLTTAPTPARCFPPCGRSQALPFIRSSTSLAESQIRSAVTWVLLPKSQIWTTPQLAAVENVAFGR